MTRSTSLRWWAGVRRNGRAAPSCAWKPSDSAYLGSALKKLQERKGLTEKQIATVMTHFERLEVSPITLTNDSIFEMDRQELRQYADEIAPWRTSMETGSSGRCRSASSITPSIRSSGAMVILRTPAVPEGGAIHGRAKVLTVKEVAALLKTSRQQIRKMILDGTLPAVKVGREWRIALGTIQAFLEES